MAAVLFTVEYKWLQNFGDLFLKLGNEISLLSVPFKYHLGVRSLFFSPSLSFRSFRVFSMVLTDTGGGCRRKGQARLSGSWPRFPPLFQVIVQSGRHPTVLQKLCQLPFQYFSDPRLIKVLFPSLIAACYNNRQNKIILEQEMSCVLLATFIQVPSVLCLILWLCVSANAVEKEKWTSCLLLLSTVSFKFFTYFCAWKLISKIREY